jgi:hypothetical protein
MPRPQDKKAPHSFRPGQPLTDCFQSGLYLSHEVSKRMNSKAYWLDNHTEALVQLVYACYRKDIEVFGYGEGYKQLSAFIREQPQNAAAELIE